nr:hypothetical protein CDCA019_107 [Cyanidium caldarium]
MKTLFRNSIELSLEEVDYAGVMYFGKIFLIAHKVFEKFLIKIKLPIATIISRTKYRLPIVQARADYVRPIHLSDKIDIILYIEKIEISSFCLQYRFFVNQKQLSAIVKLKHVCLSQTLNQSIRLPKELLLQLFYTS